ncbi:MAG: transposase [Oscillatoria sp. SIO1A7]|nr:transposase [Oscillatoria sp. SIO1A7]
MWREKDVYLLAGDEVVVTKAGKKTYGIDRFFSSLYGKPVSGLSFFALSLFMRQGKTLIPNEYRTNCIDRRGKKDNHRQTKEEEFKKAKK